MILELEDIVFNNPATNFADADGTQWMITDWEGWEGPDQRMTFLDITGFDGKALGEAALSTRTIVLEGVVKASDETKFWTAYNKFLSRTGKFFGEGILKVTEGATVKSLGYRRADAPKIKFQGSTFVFSVTLICAYPVKLQDTESSAAYNGSITVTNTGNYQTWPVITMTSTGTPVFTNTSVGSAGVSLGFTGPILSGTVLDFRKKTVTGPAAQDYYSLLQTMQDDWWPLMPGGNNLTRSGTGNATINWRNAWL